MVSFPWDSLLILRPASSASSPQPHPASPVSSSCRPVAREPLQGALGGPALVSLCLLCPRDLPPLTITATTSVSGIYELPSCKARHAPSAPSCSGPWHKPRPPLRGRLLSFAPPNPGDLASSWKVALTPPPCAAAEPEVHTGLFEWLCRDSQGIRYECGLPTPPASRLEASSQPLPLSCPPQCLTGVLPAEVIGGTCGE